MSPKISIVTIAKNSESTISATLQSVANQKGLQPGDMEHWVIDGKSSDSTPAIVKNFPHAKFISEPDEGISDAFSKGVKKSSGQWILFLNSNDRLYDDFVLKEVIEKLNNDFDFIYGKIAVVDPKSGQVLRQGGKDGAWLKLNQRMTIPHPATFTQRRYFDNFGLFDNEFKIAMDYELLLRGLNTSKYLFIPRFINLFSAGGASVDGKRAWRQAWECHRAKSKNGVGIWATRLFWFLYQGIRWSLEARLESWPAAASGYKRIAGLFYRGY